jgi:hypothetical protein
MEVKRGNVPVDGSGTAKSANPRPNIIGEGGSDINLWGEGLKFSRE